MRKYHYLVLFLVGFLLVWPFVLHKLYIEQKKGAEAFIQREAEELPEEETVSGNKTVSGDDTVSGNGTLSGNDTVSGNSTVSGNEASESGEAADGETKQDVEEAPERELSPEEFFKDTLFIGDSRTMGLVEYADLGDAAVFANTGMNVYRLYTMKNAVREQDIYLEDILAKKRYRKIYLMSGINELGYSEAQTIERFEQEVLKLRELQPDAEIVLQANLHVTTARSEKEAIFNNEGIDRINENIRQIAEKYGFSYIDVNEVFDDDTGGLRPECTHDQVHVLGKYYQEWADWIRKNGV